MSEIIKIPLGGSQENEVYSSPMTHAYQLHIKGPIQSPDKYIEWVRTIRSAGQGDYIEVHLNTEGGDAYTAIELMGCLKETEAHVHIVVEGMCASAGTMFLVTGDSWEINPYSTFMFHNYSGGAVGKGHELESKVNYDTKWAKKLMSDVYSDLLSKKEIKQMLDGKDLWMSAEEVAERISKYTDKREKAFEKRMKEVLNEAED